MICIGLKINLRLKSLGNKNKRKEANKSVGKDNIYSKSGIRFKIETSDKSALEKETDVEKFESIYALLDSTAWEEYSDMQYTTDELDISCSSYIHSDVESRKCIKKCNKKYTYWTLDTDNLLVESTNEQETVENLSHTESILKEEEEVSNPENFTQIYRDLSLDVKSVTHDSDDDSSSDVSALLSSSCQDYNYNNQYSYWKLNEDNLMIESVNEATRDDNVENLSKTESILKYVAPRIGEGKRAPEDPL